MKKTVITKTQLQSTITNILFVAGAIYAETIPAVSNLFKFGTWLWFIITLILTASAAIIQYSDENIMKKIPGVFKAIKKENMLNKKVNIFFDIAIITPLVINGWIGYAIVWTIMAFAIIYVRNTLLELKEKYED